MRKITIGPQTLIYPMPAFLIGANVAGKANFMTAAWSGIANSNPPMVTVAFQHHRHTYKGVKENGTFSINVPTEEQVKETDYCGIVSGTKQDKTGDCGFTVFYGQLKTAPLIEQCPVNLECKVVHILNLGSHAWSWARSKRPTSPRAVPPTGCPTPKRSSRSFTAPAQKSSITVWVSRWPKRSAWARISSSVSKAIHFTACIAPQFVDLKKLN